MEKIRKHIIEQMDMTREITDQEIMEMIDTQICERAKMLPMSIDERRELQKQVFYSLRRLDVLQELLEDDDITEVMVNGAAKIFYEKQGKIWLWDKQFTSKDKLDDIIQQIVSSNNRTVNEFSPIVDTRLADGSRVNVVLAPIAIDGSCISIRKFPHNPITIQNMLDFNSISEEVANLLKKLVQARYNIFISGGTGSGKTTFLNVLSCFIPAQERVITIEDSAELQIRGIPNLVRLETRNANVETGKEITIRDLIKTALRMRPDRMIVGEIRGAEALDMLQSMNTGHDGSISTGHSNSCVDMIRRIETMVLMGKELPLAAIRAQIASGIDIMVHLGRLRDKSRKILDVVEVIGYEKDEILLNPLFHFIEQNDQKGRIAGTWKKEGTLVHREKIMAAGFQGEDL